MIMAEPYQVLTARFKRGERLSADDFIELCWVHRVELHPRIAYDLKRSVSTIDMNGVRGYLGQYRYVLSDTVRQLKERLL